MVRPCRQRSGPARFGWHFAPWGQDDEGDHHFLLAPLVETALFDGSVELPRLDRGIVAVERHRPAGIFRHSIRFAAVLCWAPTVVGAVPSGSAK
jgi:hypothetical protein